MCFYCEDAAWLYKIRIEFDLAYLPFETIWLEIPDDQGVMCGVLATESGQDIGMFLWRKTRQFDWRLLEVGGFLRETGQFYPQGILKKSRDWVIPEEWLQYMAGVCMAYLTAMNCRNVGKVEHAPSDKLQKARKVRGKAPLFSFWELTVGQHRSESRAAAQGTHASPRLHLRRGHPRQYRPGELTWVSDCLVGNADTGIVLKDYRLGVKGDD